MNDAIRVAHLRAVLRLALQALNTKPRFAVGGTDSYAIAAQIDKVLAATQPTLGSTSSSSV